MQLTKNEAQRIVNDLREVIPYDLNIVDDKGTMIASTDLTRIGIYHIAGLEAIRKKKKIFINPEDVSDIYRQGINSPIIVDNVVIGAISINGDVEEVEKYIDIITNMSQALVKSIAYEKQQSDLNNKNRAIIEKIIFNQDIEDLVTQLDALFMNIESGVRIVTFEIISKPITDEIYYYILSKYQRRIIGGVIGSKIIALISEKNLENLVAIYDDVTSKYQVELQIAVGNMTQEIDQLNTSYKNCSLVNNSKKTASRLIFYFEKANFDLIVSSLPQNIKNEILQETIGLLIGAKAEGLKILLKVFLANSCSIEKTAQQLFVHKNTVIYRLEKIKKLTSLDPRKFEDAAYLYIALKITEN